MKEIKYNCLNNIKDKMEEDCEEFAFLHNDDCSCLMESPDECDCEKMITIKGICDKWMDEVNDWWIVMSKAHRKYCTPEGNKNLTKMMGKKNRFPSKDKLK